MVMPAEGGQVPGSPQLGGVWYGGTLADWQMYSAHDLFVCSILWSLRPKWRGVCFVGQHAFRQLLRMCFAGGWEYEWAAAEALPCSRQQLPAVVNAVRPKGGRTGKVTWGGVRLWGLASQSVAQSSFLEQQTPITLDIQQGSLTPPVQPLSI